MKYYARWLVTDKGDGNRNIYISTRLPSNVTSQRVNCKDATMFPEIDVARKL